MQDLKSPFISIIVPVHNAGKYLHRCLTSLINQKLKEIEIILILDCPTDGSDAVAEEYASKDNRIKIYYNIENLHTGLSRNKGVAVAKGRYIGFLDHDDYCDTLMYKLLYDAASKDNDDVIRCNFYCDYFDRNNERIEKYNYPNTTFDITNKDWIYEYVCGDKVSCVIWNHIYRTDFIRNNKIKFLDSRKICSEDSVFFMEVYLKANNLKTIPEYLYHHVFHQTNTGKNYLYRSLKKRILFFEEIYNQMIRYGIDKDVCIQYLAANLLKSLYSGSRQTLLNHSYKDGLKKIAELKSNELVNSSIDFIEKKENRKERSQLKLTIILFLQYLKR